MLNAVKHLYRSSNQVRLQAVEMLHHIQYDKWHFELNSKRQLTKNALSLFLLLLIASLAACAQKTPVQKEADDSTHVYTYVEKMPQLPEGGGMAGIVNEFLKHFHLLAFTDDGSTRYSGIHVTFVVGADGQVRDAKISKSSNNTVIDNALLVAARNLPKLSPGYHNGQAVPVRLTIPISCIKPQF